MKKFKINDLILFVMIAISVVLIAFLVIKSLNNQEPQKSLWEEIGEKSRYIEREFKKGYQDSTTIDSMKH